ncbi:MAG: hypothetical protein V1744_02185 [Candidatus Altiarchaeota archaeon]
MVVLKKNLFVVLAVVVLLSGCVKIQMREEIGPTGSSDITMTIAPANDSVKLWEEGDNPCDTMNTTNSKVTGVTCKYDGKKVTVKGKFDRAAAGGLTITGSKYRFDLVDAMKAMDEKEEGEEDNQVEMPKNKTQLKMLKDAGMAYDYYVKMPGTVTKKSGGTVQLDGSIKFDLLDPDLPDKPYVESDAGVLGLLGGAKTAADSPTKKSGGKSTGSSSSSGCCCTPVLTAVLAGLGAAASKSFY